MKLLILTAAAALTACAPLHSYDASVRGPGGQYEVTGKRGALIEVVQADGTRITADDRGHPEQPSALSNMASVAGAALINRGVD